MRLWKNTDKRALYIGSVINKLRMEGKTHITLEQLQQVLGDAFQVESADDFDADYYLKCGEQVAGPFNYTDAWSEASRMADGHQADVAILQVYDEVYFVDF